jgi:glycosyltransferase involved in cell wall biosynthesis
MTEAHVSILFCTQGTYPYFGGGVSTWCDTLCRRTPEIDYLLYAVTGDIDAAPRYDLPENVRGLIHVPLWGDPAPVDPVRKKITTRSVIETEFVPPFRRFVGALGGRVSNPIAIERAGRALYRMWQYFQRCDWETTWKHESTWYAFIEEIVKYEDRKLLLPDETPTIYDLATALRTLSHYLIPLRAPLPEVDLVHSTVAGFAGIPGILSHFAYKTPFVVTEHGVFIREQYIAISQEKTLSHFAKRFLINLSNLVCRLNYHFADLITSVADYNRRWQVKYGVDIEKTRVIYNGIDPDVFTPQPKPARTADRPTAVAATRVLPIKDIETMIRSAAVAREGIPDVLYIVCGSLDDDPGYVARCRSLVASLGLEQHFEFAGHQPRPQEIYNIGDIGILSSISEGIPYALLESMACERPFVGTDVGGIQEAIQGCGLVVPPRNPLELGGAVIKMLRDDTLRRELGRKARQKVIDQFHVVRTIGAHLTMYRQLVGQAV